MPTHTRMPSIAAAVLINMSAAGLLAGAVHAQTPILVTNGNDTGPGSLRAGLQTAAQDRGPGLILVTTEDDIQIASTLSYDGRAPLTVHGNGQTVRTEANVTLLAITEGADLTVTDLNFSGPGGFSIDKRGDLEGAGGKGIFVDVRDDQTGVVHLVLENVAVEDVAYHGVHVSDCDLADACGGGSGGGGDGAPASIAVRLANVEIRHVGYGSFDGDGIRVDERGNGGIRFDARDSLFREVGADGVELDEGDAGHVVAAVFGTRFVDNGGYCDPSLLKAFLPNEPKGKFADGEKAETDIPGPVSGSPDDRCIEREVSLYDSGFVEEYEVSIDLDDGIDIDEAGDGDLRVAITDSEIRGNLDEGVDLDEEDDGTAAVAFVRSNAVNNTDDGFRTSESGPGDLFGLLYSVTAKRNGGNGARFDEADEGTVAVEVNQTETENNDDGDATGLRVTQGGSGSGNLTVRGSKLKDGIDARNVDVVID